LKPWRKTLEEDLKESASVILNPKTAVAMLLNDKDARNLPCITKLECDPVLSTKLQAIFQESHNKNIERLGPLEKLSPPDKPILSTSRSTSPCLTSWLEMGKGRCRT
jgi:hypothetical protein